MCYTEFQKSEMNPSKLQLSEVKVSYPALSDLPENIYQDGHTFFYYNVNEGVIRYVDKCPHALYTEQSARFWFLGKYKGNKGVYIND